MGIGFIERLRALDAAALTPLVRRQSGDPALEVLDVQSRPLSGGFAGGTVGGHGTYRLKGTARSQGAIRPWSLILKVLGVVDGVGSAGQTEWNYWKREILAYQSGLLKDLPGGIVAPLCLGVVEHAGNEFWIWLEDATGAAEPRTIADYGRAARHLGQFNGHYLSGAAPLPDYPWLTRGRVRNWLDLGAKILDDLPAHLAGRTRRHWLSGTQAARVEALWRNREALLKVLDRMPRALCHHDAFCRNLFVGDDRTVAIDWQIVGTGAAGEDIMILCAVSIQFMHLPASAARDLEGAVFAGYLAGLRDAGWKGDERLVRFGYAAASALFGGVATVGMWPEVSDERGYKAIEPLIGAPIDEILDCWSALQDHFLDLGDEAIRLAETI